MPRTKKSQNVHDKKVREEAKNLKQQGFKVTADISGFKKPETIGGFRPDIIAIKENQKKIIEVETNDSKNTTRDNNQKEAFRKEANKSENTTFRRVIADND